MPQNIGPQPPPSAPTITAVPIKTVAITLTEVPRFLIFVSSFQSAKGCAHTVLLYKAAPSKLTN